MLQFVFFGLFLLALEGFMVISSLVSVFSCRLISPRKISES